MCLVLYHYDAAAVDIYVVNHHSIFPGKNTAVLSGLKTSLHVLGEHNGRKLSCTEPTPKVRALFQHILH